MNILLADSDRDLLLCYQKLLTMDGHSVTTVFDGAQAISLLVQEKFDFVILEETLPRIENEQLLEFLEKHRIPVIVLTGKGLTIKSLMKEALPNSYLPFPFLPSDLTELMQAVMEKTRSTEILNLCGVEVDVSGFCIAGTGTRLTNGEIDLLKMLVNSTKANGRRMRIMIHSLAEKLIEAGQKTRIIYETEKGYRLVNGYD